MEARKLNPLEPQEATSPPQLPAREVAEIWIKSSEKTGPKKQEEPINQSSFYKSETFGTEERKTNRR